MAGLIEMKLSGWNAPIVCSIRNFHEIQLSIRIKLIQLNAFIYERNFQLLRIYI